MLLLACLVACLQVATFAKLKSTIPCGRITQKSKTVVDEIIFKQDLNTQKIVKSIQEQAKVFVEKVQYLVEKLRGEVKVHRVEVNNAVKEVQQKFKYAAEEVKKFSRPESFASIQKELEGAITEIEEVTKVFEPSVEKMQSVVQKISKVCLEQLVVLGKTLLKSIDEAIAEHEKTHKHWRLLSWLDSVGWIQLL